MYIGRRLWSTVPQTRTPLLRTRQPGHTLLLNVCVSPLRPVCWVSQTAATTGDQLLQSIDHHTPALPRLVAAGPRCMLPPISCHPGSLTEIHRPCCTWPQTAHVLYVLLEPQSGYGNGAVSGRALCIFYVANGKTLSMVVAVFLDGLVGKREKENKQKKKLG
ncbi:hypothetical protein MAPG_07181 [Magnaporthiopsis poae ATCC 64411]|uniref:Uncharacterized protein n=1 Tax=Magnaporthiopsis poae (strain ATCC 64411 / 73-15) TaxID=644358 RepID=A0A0C4E3Z9_MAGP6|nr:hypothetical protein MAPG_07181 [Magnaporthiopsis poae ATCC 64411]